MSSTNTEHILTARQLEEEAALRLLQERGWTVKKTGVFRKRTFEVEEEVYKAFRAVQENLGLKVKDALNVVLCDWIRKHATGKGGRS